MTGRFRLLACDRFLTCDFALVCLGILLAHQELDVTIEQGAALRCRHASPTTCERCRQDQGARSRTGQAHCRQRSVMSDAVDALRTQLRARSVMRLPTQPCNTSARPRSPESPRLSVRRLATSAGSVTFCALSSSSTMRSTIV